MNILWLTWKDRKHPLAGGAEVVNEELAKHLARDGHEVKFIVAGLRGYGRAMSIATASISIASGIAMPSIGRRIATTRSIFRTGLIS